MKRLIVNLVLRMNLLLLLVACLPASSADEFAAPLYVPDSKKESAWLFGMNRTYDEWFVHQKAVHVKDPYIWVYNEDFAKDFGMPERWIDKTLTGADALAFRTGTAFPLCGWGGKTDSCNVSHECILEMYFNRKLNPLPWSKRSRWTDLQLNQTSAWTLSSLRPINRDESKNLGPRSPLADPDGGRELFWWYEYETKGMSGGAARVRSYDKSIFENYAVVIINIDCIRQEYSGLQLRPNPVSGQPNTSFLSLNFPKTWRERIQPSMNDAVERESSFFKEKFSGLKGAPN